MRQDTSTRGSLIFRSTDVGQSYIRCAADHARTIITTERTNGPCQVDDAVACDTAATQAGMTVWAKDILVVDTALALWADELLFDIVAQIFFFE